MYFCNGFFGEKKNDTKMMLPGNTCVCLQFFSIIFKNFQRNWSKTWTNGLYLPPELLWEYKKLLELIQIFIKTQKTDFSKMALGLCQVW